MATIITVSSNDFGTGVIQKLKEAFPDAHYVRADLCTRGDISEIDFTKTVIIDNYKYSPVQSYLIQRIDEALR
jgi:hypothetical protein